MNVDHTKLQNTALGWSSMNDCNPMNIVIVILSLLSEWMQVQYDCLFDSLVEVVEECIW